MRKWEVSVSWSRTFEAEDEGDALIQADGSFSFMSEARCEEIEPEDVEESE